MDDRQNWCARLGIIPGIVRDRITSTSVAECHRLGKSRRGAKQQ